MLKQDEMRLWDLVKDLEGPIDWVSWFDKIKMNHKRGFYLVEKWCDKGIVNYGTSIRYAWVEQR